MKVFFMYLVSFKHLSIAVESELHYCTLKYKINKSTISICVTCLVNKILQYNTTSSFSQVVKNEKFQANYLNF
jgi:hypothetical protein